MRACKTLSDHRYWLIQRLDTTTYYVQPHACEPSTTVHVWSGTNSYTIHQHNVVCTLLNVNASEHPPPTRAHTYKWKCDIFFCFTHFPNIHCQRPTPTYRDVYHAGCSRGYAISIRTWCTKRSTAAPLRSSRACGVGAICLRFRRCAHCLVSAVVGGASSAQQHRITTHNQNARPPNKFASHRDDRPGCSCVYTSIDNG